MLSVVTCALMLTLFRTGNAETNMERDIRPELVEVPVSAWTTLAGKRIFFGHQSVGYNIVDGLQAVMKEQPALRLNITETRKIADVRGPVFAHFPVGRNKDPYAKCDDFKVAVAENSGKMDIAFFKFCYVDVVAETDVKGVFKYYNDTMDFLRAQYPQIRFVAMTVPLRTVNMSKSARMKRFLGRYVWGDDDNIKRNAFNKLVREKYGNGSDLFDIARVGSSYPGPEPAAFRKMGRGYEILSPALSSDGGHLNEAGAMTVASALLLHLAGQ